MSLDISSMTDSNCWYFVWLAGSKAPLVVGVGIDVIEALPVGVLGAGGLGVVEADGLAEVGVDGVLDLEPPPPPPYSLDADEAPPTLVRLVPAAASNCC